MELNITKLANIEGNKSQQDFLNRIQSKLMMDVSKSQIVENDEWLDMLDFSIPHLQLL